MKQEDLLINRLIRYGKGDMYPFHMPGHKREGDMGVGNPFSVDITEIHGFDNLHHPEGILKESMEWAAGLYGADKTFYLINGSTSGVIAAVCGSVTRGGHILVSRNCHKSVYHGIYLNQLTASYVYPQEVPGLGIQGGINPSDVDKMLKQHGDIQAVLIVSPTYDGVVSDIKGIGEVVHGAGLPLIVDEAHGAHFRYGEMFPASALGLGADVVVQSVHKTMPSLTQTALLHIKNSRPGQRCCTNAKRIEQYLHMIQSSSPSYLLLASIENSIFSMENMDFSEYREGLGRLRKRLGGLKRLGLVDRKLVGKYGIFDLDLSKLVISARGVLQENVIGRRAWGEADLPGIGFVETGFTGAMLGDILRQEYHLEMEMCGADYVTAITTVMDRPEGLVRLGDALLEIDKRLELDGRDMLNGRSGQDKPGQRENQDKPGQWENQDKPGQWENQDKDIPWGSVYSMRNETSMTIAEAMDGELSSVKLKDSEGCISGEYVYIYPPGIPILAPGERISRQILDIIVEYMDKKLPVQGPLDQTMTYIRTVKQKAGT